MQLQAAVDDALRGLGGEELRHGRGASRALLADIAFPRSPVDEQRTCVDFGAHVANGGLRHLQVEQRCAKHAARSAAIDGKIKSGLGEAKRRGTDRGAKYVEVLQCDFETLAGVRESLGRGDFTLRKCQRRDRVGRTDVEALADRQAGRVRINHERAKAFNLIAFQAREHCVEIGNPRVGDPRLDAVKPVRRAAAGGARGHRCGIGSCIGLRERKGGNGFARRHLRQIPALQGIRAKESDRAASQSLHRKGEIGKAVVIAQRLACHAEAARIKLRQCAAERFGHGIAQPSCLAQVAHDALTQRVDIAHVRAMRKTGSCPRVQAIVQRAMPFIEKREFQDFRIEHFRRTPSCRT